MQKEQAEEMINALWKIEKQLGNINYQLERIRVVQEKEK